MLVQKSLTKKFLCASIAFKYFLAFNFSFKNRRRTHVVLIGILENAQKILTKRIFVVRTEILFLDALAIKIHS